MHNCILSKGMLIAAQYTFKSEKDELSWDDTTFRANKKLPWKNKYEAEINDLNKNKNSNGIASWMHTKRFEIWNVSYRCELEILDENNSEQFEHLICLCFVLSIGFVW